MQPISLAHAHIRHRRYTPKPHAFEYQMGYVLANIDTLAQVCDRSLFWSYNRFNLISLYDKDLLKSDQRNVRETLSDAILAQLGQSISTAQPIYVLTLPRYMGWAFNPVTFYWVYDAHSPILKFIAAHITNTPWHESFLYCFSCEQSHTSPSTTASKSAKSSPVYRFLLDKQFHVSPFMPMALKYDWRFKLDQMQGSSHSVIHMQLKQHGKLIFDATMQFDLEPLTHRQQSLFVLTYPLQSLKIVWAIYWQALRLYLKRIPFFSHPATHKEYQ
jgi:uncharacterized protein